MSSEMAHLAEQAQEQAERDHAEVVRLQLALDATEAANADGLKKNGELLGRVKSLEAKLDALGDAAVADEVEAERPMNLVPEYDGECLACGQPCSTWMVIDAERVYLCMPDWHAWRLSSSYTVWQVATKSALQNFRDVQVAKKLTLGAQSSPPGALTPKST